MKKLVKLFLAIVLMSGITSTVMAQVPQVTTTNPTAAGARILTALSIVENLPMHFGTLGVAAGVAGTCVVSTAGERSATGGVNLSALAPLFSLATYTVTGEPLYTYLITLPDDITVTHTNTVNTMVIGTLLALPASGIESHTATGTLIAVAGTNSFTVGGTLNVGATQLAGVYAGTFNVTVAYN
jgi:hypothetical protein